MNLETIFQNVVKGQAPDVELGVQAALSSGMPAEEILNNALIAAMDEIGKQFEQGDLFVPEMLIAARAMQAGLNLLKPLLAESGVQSAGIVAMGTVKGDLHDIGKNLVAMMFEGAGFEVIDVGTDVEPAVFAETVRNGAIVVGMSAMLTTTMPAMADVIEALEDTNVRDQVKVIIGGAPVTPEFAEKINADGYAADASSAVTKVQEMLG